MTEFRGRLKALSCADVLEFLRVLNRRGLLSLATEGASIGLYLREDRMVHATSSRSGDRLSERKSIFGSSSHVTNAEHTIRNIHL